MAETKNKGGRPFHVPTAEQRKIVESMAGFGIPQESIGKVVGVGPDALRAHYRTELDNGMTVANYNVAKNLYAIAQGTGREAVTACIFWLKTRAGWSEYGPTPKNQEEPIGKKEQANREAVTAAQDTGWANLVH